MLSAIHAMPMMTTSVALVSVSPPESSANGKMASAMAATATGERSAFIPRPRCAERSFEPQNAFAEQSARPKQQHEHHQQVHRCFGRRRKEINGESAHDTDDQRRAHDAPKRTQAADHDDDERCGENFRAHRGMHAGYRRE